MKLVSKKTYRAWAIPILAILLLTAPAPLLAQSADELVERGNLALERKSYTQAIQAYRQALKLEIWNYEAQYNLGLAYLGAGRYAEAVEELRKITARTSFDAIVWSNLAVAYENLGDKAGVAEALAKAAEIDPTDATIRLNLAAMHINNKNIPKAVEQYMAIVKMGDPDPEVLVSLGKCLTELKRFAEAKKYFLDAAEADPYNVEPRFELADIYRRRDKNLDKAAAELLLAIDIRPDMPELYEAYADILADQGKKAEAIEQLNKALSLASTGDEAARIKMSISKIDSRR